MKGKFAITVGAPGSGKSTWADQFEGHDTLRIERDRMRVALFGSQRNYWDQTDVFNGDRTRHRKLSAIVGSSMARAMDTAINLDTHKNFIMSDTGAQWSSVMRFHERARRAGLEIEVNFFDVPWEILMERNKLREGTDKAAPEFFIRDTYEKVMGLKPTDRQWWKEPKLYDKFIVRDEYGNVKNV
ncbi:MAG: AAA family ATPase [Sphingomonas sp.]|uniref:AAA family ATPase n=1 Tax=Sphingomonas sp. TaxID=28214 RepID=UPI003F80418A